MSFINLSQFIEFKIYLETLDHSTIYPVPHRVNFCTLQIPHNVKTHPKEAIKKYLRTSTFCQHTRFTRNYIFASIRDNKLKSNTTNFNFLN